MGEFKIGKNTKEYSMLHLNLYLLAKEHEQVKELAKKNGMKMSLLVRDMIRHCLQDLNKGPK